MKVGALARVWSSLVPGTVVKLGRGYLILYDAGEKARSLLAASFISLLEAGVRLVIADPARSPFLDKTLSSDAHFEKWEERGKLVRVHAGTRNDQLDQNYAFPGRGPAGTVYVVAVADEKLDTVASALWKASKKLPNTTGMFLVEKDKVKRPQLTQFLQRNKGIRFLDLSTVKTPFSSALRLNHSKLQGSTILLEHDSGSNLEAAVQEFLSEAISYGELSAVFTSKTSKLYNSLKGTKRLKLVAASSLATEPEEQPDGEIRIPDKELGYVTSITLDLLESSKGIPVCFVFDSIMDLVKGEQWEGIYNGVRQIVELAARPNVTTLFLVNRGDLEPRFLGALRSIFQIQLTLGQEGLQVAKPPS